MNENSPSWVLTLMLACLSIQGCVISCQNIENERMLNVINRKQDKIQAIMVTAKDSEIEHLKKLDKEKFSDK